MPDQQEEQTIYKVVVNHEEQYSLWPANTANALAGTMRVKAAQSYESLAYSKEVWTEMRPLSLRKRMQSKGWYSDSTAFPVGSRAV
jgi:MbtH protein